MEEPPQPDWSMLHEFSDPIEARDVITTILSMDFDALLIDTSSDRIVAGSTLEDPSAPEGAEQPIELQPRLNLRDPSMPVPVPRSQAPRIPDAGESRRLELGDGPWQVLVPPDAREELAPLLEAILAEQSEFDARHEELRRSETTLMRYALLTLLVLFGCFLLLRLVGVL